MLNRDIYQRIALYASIDLLKTFSECGTEFVDAINNDLFWEHKFSCDHIPFLYTTAKTLDEWIDEYKNAVNIMTQVEIYLKNQTVTDIGKIYIPYIRLSTARKILLQSRYADKIYYTVATCDNPRDKFNLCIISQNGFIDSKIYREVYGPLQDDNHEIDLSYDEVFKILYLSKYFKETVISYLGDAFVMI